jgi:hypothetical protein
MSSLTGQQIKDTYLSLLKVNDNGQISNVSQSITDGAGNPSGLYLTNDGVTVSGSLSVGGTINLTGSLMVNGIPVISGSVIEVPFSYNRTFGINTIKQYESILNPGNLLVLSNNIFIVEENAEYYVLGDLRNSGSLIVSGTIHIDGGLYNSGSIVGPGIIE